MITNSQNTALNNLLEKIPDTETFILYKGYCKYREQGLRKLAFEQLKLFIEEFKSYDLSSKIWFTDLILANAESVKDGDYGPMPHTLKEIIIKPTLILWANFEPLNYLPLYWLAKFFYDHDALRKALNINPLEQKPLIQDIEWKIGALYESTHHLPHFYIGDVDADLILADEIKHKIEGVINEREKIRLHTEFNFYESLMLSYKSWKISGTKDFTEWAKANNKDCESGIKAFYYSK